MNPIPRNSVILLLPSRVFSLIPIKMFFRTSTPFLHSRKQQSRFFVSAMPCTGIPTFSATVLLWLLTLLTVSILLPEASRSYHLKAQERAMCNLSATAIRALLQNPTLPNNFVEAFLEKIIEKSKTDNGEAVSVLLQDDRVHVEPTVLDTVLRKDRVFMCAALQQNEAVRAAIQMCSTCAKNIGIYKCFRESKCVQVARKGETKAPPGQRHVGSQALP